MSILRRCSPSPAAAPPLEDEDLLAEILLRLPPDPSSLPRASAVCKRWRHLVSDPRFVRRFRRHHRRNPTLLGFFNTYHCISFQPILEAPNRVPPGRFSLQLDDGDGFRLLGCRHGLILFVVLKRKQVWVWDPITGDQHGCAVPTGFAPIEYINGAVVRAAGDAHFRVVLIGIDEQGESAIARVYSSQTAVWGNLISTPLPSEDPMIFISTPAVLVGDSLYWLMLAGPLSTLEFDLDRQTLAVASAPVDFFS